MTSLAIDVVLFSCMFVLVTGIIITAAPLSAIDSGAAQGADWRRIWSPTWPRAL
jgi:hypothetical protein